LFASTDHVFIDLFPASEVDKDAEYTTYFFVKYTIENELPLTKTKNSKRKSWTAIPKARRKEAEEVGALICEYLSGNNPG
jgi:hypothetical protein